MTRSPLLAISVLSCLAVSSAVAGGALPIGAMIPMADVAMKNVDGKEINLKSIVQPAGTLVVFTCNQCPLAKMWESRIIEIGNAYAAKGIGVVAINANDPKAYPEDAFDAMQVRAKEKGMEFPYVVDATSNVARAFGATKTPEAFLFDKNGKLVYRRQRPGTLQGRNRVSEARARGRPFRWERARERGEIDRLRDQVPLVTPGRSAG